MAKEDKILEEVTAKEYQYGFTTNVESDKIPKVGSLFRNSAYANLIDYLGNYEKKITGSRNNKFNKLHDAFYKGDVANSILKYSQKNEGLLWNRC